VCFAGLLVSCFRALVIERGASPCMSILRQKLFCSPWFLLVRFNAATMLVWFANLAAGFLCFVSRASEVLLR
jgi:hypothetical protein